MAQIYTPDGEMSILGAMLLSGRAAEEAVALLSEDDFVRPAHVTMFAALSAIVARRAPIDPVILTEELKARGELENVGGAAYIGELDLFVPSAANVEEYIKIVRRYANRRRVIDSARILTRMAQDDEEPEAMQAEAASIGERLAVAGTKVPEVDVRSALDRLLTGKAGKGYSTGFPSIDNQICKRRGGMAAKQYTLISAPSGEGKSSFMLSILFRAMARGERCVFGSFADLDEEEVMYRAVRFANPYGQGRLSEARDEAERKAILDAADAVSRWPFGFYDASESEGANSIEVFRAWLRRWSEKNGAPTRAGLDYAQVIRTSNAQFSGHPTTANQHVSHAVRLMAATYDAAFMVGSQVTKKPDGELQTKHASDWFDHAAMEIQVTRGALKITKNRHGIDRCEVPTAWDPVRLIVNEEAEA